MPEPNFKSGPTRDALYLRYIRRQPCCICGDNVSVEAHHPRVGTINGDETTDPLLRQLKNKSPGMAQKASDKWALPLCGKHHRQAHAMSEALFWKSHGLDPYALAMHYHANPDDDPLVAAMKERDRNGKKS